MHTFSLLDVYEDFHIALPDNETILTQIFQTDDLQLRKCVIMNSAHKEYLIQRAQKIGFKISPAIVEGLRKYVTIQDNRFYAWTPRLNIRRKMGYAKRSLDAHREASQ